MTKEILINEHHNNKLTVKQIAKKYNYNEVTIRRNLHKFNIKLNWNRKHKHIDITNKKFGKLLTIKKIGSDKNKRVLWQCKCDCGNECIVVGRYLRTGDTKSCNHCRLNEIIPDWCYLEIYRQSIRRNIIFKLTKQEMIDLLIKQDYKCKLSQLSLFIPIAFKNKKQKTASLDRIDSSKGYTIDNVQWVHKTVNYMKMDLVQKEFISICKRISNTHD